MKFSYLQRVHEGIFARILTLYMRPFPCVYFQRNPRTRQLAKIPKLIPTNRNLSQHEFSVAFTLQTVDKIASF